MIETQSLSLLLFLECPAIKERIDEDCMLCSRVRATDGHKHDLAIGSFTTNRQFEIMSTEGRHEEAKD